MGRMLPDEHRLPFHVQKNLAVQGDAALAALRGEAMGELAEFLRAGLDVKWVNECTAKDGLFLHNAGPPA